MSDDKIDVLIRQLASRDDNVRGNARDTLVKIGKPAVPALVDTLKDRDANVRLIAAYALGEIGDARAVPALIDALKSKHHSVRFGAIALGKIKDAKAVPALIDALKDEDWYVRYDAVHALRRILGVKETEGILMKELDKAKGREEKKNLFGLFEEINKKKNELLEPEVKKLKPPKIIKRRKRRRRIWRAVQ